MYRWVGWFDGREDCDPPEPGKYWIAIEDGAFNEICIIVHRVVGSVDFELDNTRPEVLEKERNAAWIVNALNAYGPPYEKEDF